MNPNELKPGDRIMIPATVDQLYADVSDYPHKIKIDNSYVNNWINNEGLKHAHLITPDKPVADKDNFQFRYDGSEEGLNLKKQLSSDFNSKKYGVGHYYGKKNGKALWYNPACGYHDYSSIPIVTIPEAIRLMGGDAELDVPPQWIPKQGELVEISEDNNKWAGVFRFLCINSYGINIIENDIGAPKTSKYIRPIPTTPTMEEELEGFLFNHEEFIPDILAWHTKHQPSIPSATEFYEFIAKQSNGWKQGVIETYAHFGMDKLVRKEATNG